MSSTAELLAPIPKSAPANAPSASDVLYAQQAHALVLDALQKGFEVVQMPNGELQITEIRTVTYRYQWNDQTSRFERAATRRKQARKPRKPRSVIAPAKIAS